MAIQQTLRGAEHDWFATQSGLPANAPLTEHKAVVFGNAGLGGANKTLSQMESEWLGKIAGSNSQGMGDLWREAVARIGLTPDRSMTANQLLFYTSDYSQLSAYILALPNLNAYYPMGESSGNAINKAPATIGTLDGTPTSVTQGVAGQTGKAYSFDGAASYVDCSNPAATSTMSWFAMFKYSAWPGAAAFADVLRKESSYYIELTGSNDTNGIAVGAKDPVDRKVTIPKTDTVQDTWYFVTGISDGANVTAYLNGTAYTPTGVGNVQNTTANKVFIGTYGTTIPSLGRWFQGSIQHVGIVNGILTSTQAMKMAKLAGLA